MNRIINIKLLSHTYYDYRQKRLQSYLFEMHFMCEQIQLIMWIERSYVHATISRDFFGK